MAENVVYTCCGADPATGRIPQAKRLTPNGTVCMACLRRLQAFWALFR